MKYYSTNLNSDKVSFETALFKGLAPDGGLYMPEIIPNFNMEFFNSEWKYSQLATELIFPFVEGEINQSSLEKICESAFNFKIPLVKLNDQIQILELFHGPTFAFKDFAARFMARTMQYFMQNQKVEKTVLVATSGDTGSAVANGFYKVDGINVVISYPLGRVSKIQEQQLTTLGENVTAIEVEGSFDDCQKMVKTAFLDFEIQDKKQLSSANSINISRLLPQSIYYSWAWICAGRPKDLLVSVPSGNFGNLTGGIIAKHMGLPVEKFIAATNANDVFPKYLETGEFNAMPSKQTISNAMDVGMPSNFDRILKIYNENVNKLRRDLTSWSFQDNETKYAIKYTKDKLNYLADPHTAVGLSGIEKYRQEVNKNLTGIALATAHPGKFPQVVEPVINEKIVIPKQLQKSMEKEKNSIIIPAHYSYLKEFLIHN